MLLIAVISAFIIYTFLTTKYVIDHDNLQVKSGLSFNKTVAIKSIRKIIETKSLISSPALSIDRIEVFYNNFDSIIISPKDKSEFIKQLQKVNDQIEIKVKGNAST